MKISKVPNYEIVRLTMQSFKEEFLSKSKIANQSGLTQSQVSLIIKCAWKLGWVSRIERKLNDNAFGKKKFSSIKTQYKIKKLDSWMGLIPLYREVLENERK
jgi:predicted transcriptional regulator